MGTKSEPFTSSLTSENSTDTYFFPPAAKLPSFKSFSGSGLRKIYVPSHYFCPGLTFPSPRGPCASKFFLWTLHLQHLSHLKTEKLSSPDLLLCQPTFLLHAQAPIGVQRGARHFGFMWGRLSQDC
jgi:hypothetical protein